MRAIVNKAKVTKPKRGIPPARREPLGSMTVSPPTIQVQAQGVRKLSLADLDEFLFAIENFKKC